MNYEEVKIHEWKELEGLEIAFGCKIYRGQANPAWDITSSLQRLLFHAQEDEPLNREHWILYEFKRKAHLYLSDLPERDDTVSWIALMQHHGAPTRFVDFTDSFYVACFFALAESSGECAVWAIDEPRLRTIALANVDTYYDRAARSKGALRDEEVLGINNYASDYLNDILARNKNIYAGYEGVSPGAVMVDPYKKSMRAALQKGVFVMPLDIKQNLVDNLLKNVEVLPDSLFSNADIERIAEKIGPGFKERVRANIASNAKDVSTLVTKITLSEDFREEAMFHLEQMNINYETLFPGIDGFARSLRHTVMW